MHYRLANATDDSLRSNDNWTLDANVLDAFSRIFIGSSVRNIVDFLRKINSGTYYDNATNAMIDHVLGVASDTPSGRKLFKRNGAKGGSANYPNMTDAVLNIAAYETD